LGKQFEMCHLAYSVCLKADDIGVILRYTIGTSETDVS